MIVFFTPILGAFLISGALTIDEVLPGAAISRAGSERETDSCLRN